MQTLVPISQPILLKIYTPKERGSRHGPVRRLGDCGILGRSGYGNRYGIDIWPLIFVADFPRVLSVPVWQHRPELIPGTDRLILLIVVMASNSLMIAARLVEESLLGDDFIT